MKIYEAERELGLADKISVASVRFDAPLKSNHIPVHFTKASQTDEDLYYLQSVLVSVGWNKNDDVFDRLPVWQARKTPSHKQLNMEHDSKRVVGHILDCFGIDEEGKQIPDSIAEANLPDRFHLVTPSVLYKFIAKGEDLEKEMETVINEIEQGKWFVSMECLFDDFDYAMQKDGKNVVMKRDSATAHLSKSLRAYGGEGFYTAANGDKYKIGRVLKNLVFSGKGLTKKPANPESIIFANTENFVNSVVANDLGYLSQVDKSNVEKNMPLENELAVANEKVSTLQSTVAAVQKKNEELQKQVQELSDKEVNGKLTAATAEVAQLKEKVSGLEASVKAEQTSRSDAEKKVETLTADLAKANDELSKVKSAQAEIERVTKLVDKTGMERDAAVKLVKTLASLSDENFGVFLDTQPAKKEEKKETVKASEDNKKVLEDAEKEKEKATLANAGEVPLENWSALASLFNKKNK